MTGGDGIAPPAEAGGRRRPRMLRIHPVPLRVEPRNFLELAALCAFAITSPVLEAFGDLPSWLVLRDASRGTSGKWSVASTVSSSDGFGWRRQRLLTLLAPDALRPGANDLDAFLVVDDGASDAVVGLASLTIGR